MIMIIIMFKKCMCWETYLKEIPWNYKSISVEVVRFGEDFLYPSSIIFFTLIIFLI